MPHTSFGLSAYRATTVLLSLVAPLLLRRRIARGKENSRRIGERLGHPLRPRPEGTLLWVHGASVGECVAALPLIDELSARIKANILVTSGTVTSAEVMEKRLPANAFHQFVPVDTPGAVKRFLDHWRPQVGLFVDSDIWPNLILGANERGIPIAIVNARMSQRSFQNWRRVHASALFSAIAATLAQDEEAAARFRILGVKDVRICGSLKADAPSLPADEAALAALRQAIGARPVLLAAQTHPGEEETILPASDLLRYSFPDLLTIIVPRHPERGAYIAALCGTRQIARRSQHQSIGPDTAIYIADTIGELGLFYRLASFAFVGGSLIAHGGQNPLEPAALGCAVLAGRHTFNFPAAYQAIFEAQGIGLVETAAEICAAAKKLLADPPYARALGASAAAGAKTLCGAASATAEFVEKLVDHAHP